MNAPKTQTKRKYMNRFSSVKARWRASLGFAVLGVAIFVSSLAYLQAADPAPDKATKAEPTTAKKAEKKKFSGADLYAMHCNRCHPERYATERTAAQWKTLLIHMRVRANLPAEQARQIMKYLQEDSGKP